MLVTDANACAEAPADGCDFQITQVKDRVKPRSLLILSSFLTRTLTAQFPCSQLSLHKQRQFIKGVITIETLPSVSIVAVGGDLLQSIACSYYIEAEFLRFGVVGASYTQNK